MPALGRGLWDASGTLNCPVFPLFGVNPWARCFSVSIEGVNTGQPSTMPNAWPLGGQSHVLRTSPQAPCFFPPADFKAITLGPPSGFLCGFGILLPRGGPGTVSSQVGMCQHGDAWPAHVH